MERKGLVVGGGEKAGTADSSIQIYGVWYYCERSELLIWQVHQFGLGCIKNCAH